MLKYLTPEGVSERKFFTPNTPLETVLSGYVSFRKKDLLTPVIVKDYKSNQFSFMVSVGRHQNRKIELRLKGKKIRCQRTRTHEM